MILTISAVEGKKNINNIDTNKENKNSLTIKVNYNPAQAAEAKKFPRNNNLLTEMNKEHILEEDLEKTIDNENREEIQQKGQKRKNPIGEQEHEVAIKIKKEKKLETQ